MPVRPDGIDYICARLAGTPLNDSTETKPSTLALGEHAYGLMNPQKVDGRPLLGGSGALRRAR
jgi:3-oxoacyl-(acyl-carrier-protein) synthase